MCFVLTVYIAMVLVLKISIHFFHFDLILTLSSVFCGLIHTTAVSKASKQP